MNFVRIFHDLLFSCLQARSQDFGGDGVRVGDDSSSQYEKENGSVTP